MPRTSTGPARCSRSAGWTRRSATRRTPCASTPTRSAIGSCSRRCFPAEGAHRDAAAEFGRLARNDPRQTSLDGRGGAGATGRLTAGDGRRRGAARGSARAAERAAQLALSQALARTGDARGAFQAAVPRRASCAGLPEAREALADAHWLSNDGRSRLRRVPRLGRRADRRGSRSCGRKGANACTDSMPVGPVGWSRRSARCSRGIPSRLAPRRGDDESASCASGSGRARAAMRNREADAVALTADRTKAMAVALAGMADDAEVEVGRARPADARSGHRAGLPSRARAAADPHRAAAGTSHRRRLSRYWSTISGRCSRSATASRGAGGCDRADECRPSGTPVASACSVSIEAVLFRSDGSDDSLELEGRDAIRIAKDELLWVDAGVARLGRAGDRSTGTGPERRAVAALKARRSRTRRSSRARSRSWSGSWPTEPTARSDRRPDPRR